MIEVPGIETEWISSISGTRRSASSSGRVTRRSMRSADSPGYSVAITASRMVIFGSSRVGSVK